MTWPYWIGVTPEGIFLKGMEEINEHGGREAKLKYGFASIHVKNWHDHLNLREWVEIYRFHYPLSPFTTKTCPGWHALIQV